MRQFLVLFSTGILLSLLVILAACTKKETVNCQNNKKLIENCEFESNNQLSDIFLREHKRTKKLVYV